MSTGGSADRRRRLAGLLLGPFLDAREREQVVADLEELRTVRRREVGSVRASVRYWWEVARFPWALLIQSAIGGVASGSGGSRRGVAALVELIVFDSRHAFRRLVRNRSYTMAVLTTLTVTIGAATAVFAALNGVLLRPLPHPEPDRLVRLYEVDRRAATVEDHNPVAVANFRDWSERNTTFDGIAAFGTDNVTYSVDGSLERVPTAIVSSEFFRFIGVQPVTGRLFTEEEYTRGQDNVVLLGHSYWQNRFAGDPAIVGRSLESGGSELTIVGVLPPGFRFLERDVDVWSPMTFSETSLSNRRSHWLWVMGRMRPGVTVEQAQEDMSRVVAELRPEYPEFLEGWDVNVIPLIDDIVGGTKPVLLLLFSAVGFVVLLGCVNVAAVTLARALESSAETDVRSAIGASPARLIWERTLDGAFLAVCGVVLGLAFAYGATRTLLAVAPATLPRAEAIGVDARVMLFAVAVSLSTTLLGTAITFRSLRSGLASGLRSIGRTVTATKSRKRWQGLFVGAQIALSLTLLVSAGLMLRSLTGLLSVDPGFTADRVQTMSVQLPGTQYPTTLEQAPVLDRILESLQSTPGIAAAGFTNYLPMADMEGTWSVQIVGQPERLPNEKRDYGMHQVSPGYFAAMRIPLVSGRYLNDSDRAGRPLVVVVNEAFVHRFFPGGEDPLGRRMHLIARPEETYEIVGVVRDVHHYSLDVAPTGAYYFSYRQLSDYYWMGSSRLVVRMESAVPLLPAVRDAGLAIDPGILVFDARSMTDRVEASESVARARFASMLLAVFGAVALSLTAIGVYGVVTQWTRARHREIGIRLTMGATPRGVVGSLVIECGRIVLVGMVAGLAGAVAFARVQSSLLFGVAPFDAATYGVAAMLVIVGALIATVLPALQAGRTDPATVLRSDFEGTSR